MSAGTRFSGKENVSLCRGHRAEGVWLSDQDLTALQAEYVRNVFDAHGSKGFAVEHHFCPAFLNP